MHFLKSTLFFFAFDLCACCSLLWKTLSLTSFIFPEHISRLEKWPYSFTLIAMSRILYMLSNFSNEKLELRRYLGLIFLSLFSRSVTSDYLLPHRLQHARLPCPSPSPGACSNSCPLSWWCHPTILSSVVPFYSCLQSFPASGSFLKSLLQCHSSKTSILQCSAFFMVQLSHPYVTTGKTIALTKP